MKHLAFLVAIVVITVPLSLAGAQPAGNAVIIVVDESNSVTEHDHGGRRWQLASAVIDALDEGDAANAIRFASTARLIFPSWSLVAGQRTTLKAALRTPMALGGNTNVREALEIALAQFAPVATLYKQRLVFLISDGRFPWTEELTRLLLLYKNAGVVIHTIGVDPTGEQARLRAVAVLTGGAHLSQLTPDILQQLLRGKPSDDNPRPFPWAEIESRLGVDLRGPERLTEREQILLEAAVALDGRPTADEQKIATPWGTATLVVHRVQIAVDQQVVGDMAREGQRYILRLPSLNVGAHRAQATAFVLLRSGDAEHVAAVPSPELVLVVEAVPRSGISLPAVGLALASLALLAVPVVRRVRRRRRALRPGWECTFEKDHVTIGSAPENDLVVFGEGIGDQHLSIRRELDGRFTITDESGLGVEINDRVVRVGELRDGDHIKFGEYRMQFRRTGAGFTLRVLSNSAN